MLFCHEVSRKQRVFSQKNTEGQSFCNKTASFVTKILPKYQQRLCQRICVVLHLRYVATLHPRIALATYGLTSSDLRYACPPQEPRSMVRSGSPPSLRPPNTLGHFLHHEIAPILNRGPPLIRSTLPRMQERLPPAALFLILRLSEPRFRLVPHPFTTPARSHRPLNSRVPPSSGLALLRPSEGTPLE